MATQVVVVPSPKLNPNDDKNVANMLHQGFLFQHDNFQNVMFTLHFEDPDRHPGITFFLI